MNIAISHRDVLDNTDFLSLGSRRFSSRLLIGTGKYRDFDETRAAVEASGAEIVTVAIRRTNIGQDPLAPNLLDVLAPQRYTILPNTAGCYSAEDAIRTLRLARELLDGHTLVKLEVLGDPQTLFPHMPETIKAAETLVNDGFDVMAYCSDDPIQARILERAQVPVIVDAGVGTASDAAIAMELGCAGVLMNTAIAAAREPVLMAQAMRKAVDAGRDAFLAGRMTRKLYSGAPSSPTGGMIAPAKGD